MARAKKYSVDNSKMVINAQIAALNAKELKEVKNYIALGYKLVEVIPKPMTKEEKAAAAAENKKKKAAEQAANPYSKDNVEAFLKKKENKEYYDEYLKRYKEQAGTNRTVKGKAIADEPKYLKDGRIKVKGYANCIGWFTENFEYNKETKEYIKK